MAEGGWYSLVQWRPEGGRMEAVNCGLIVVGPRYAKPLMRVVSVADRVRCLVGAGVDVAHVQSATRSFDRRIHKACMDFDSAEALDAWSERLGNEIVMTRARGVAFYADRQATFDEMFGRLVKLPPPESPRRSRLGNRVRAFFDRKEFDGWARRDAAIEVPQVKTIVAPYAYENRVLNLVKPIALTARAADDARYWALVQGLLRSAPDAEVREAQVEAILASAHDAEERKRLDECESVLADSGVRVYEETRLEEFKEHVLAARDARR